LGIPGTECYMRCTAVYLFHTDTDIFEAAKKADAVVMSKDNDFIQLIEQKGTPPKLIWITCDNTSNARLGDILSTALLKTKEL